MLPTWAYPTCHCTWQKVSRFNFSICLGSHPIVSPILFQENERVKKDPICSHWIFSHWLIARGLRMTDFQLHAAADWRPPTASNGVLPCRMTNVISGNTADEPPLNTKMTIKCMVPNRMLFIVKGGAVSKDAWTAGGSRAVAWQTGPEKEWLGLYGRMSFCDTIALCGAPVSSDGEHNRSHLFPNIEDLLCARTKLGTIKDSFLPSSGGKKTHRWLTLVRVTMLTYIYRELAIQHTLRCWIFVHHLT